jgi:hypothetical protein
MCAQIMLEEDTNQRLYGNIAQLHKPDCAPHKPGQPSITHNSTKSAQMQPHPEAPEERTF